MSFAGTRKFWIALSLGLALVLSAAIFLLFADLGTITVHNESPHVLKKVSVTVQGTRYTFPDLDPGASADRRFFKRAQDGNFTLVASRSDGTSLQEENGYIPGRFGHESATFRVKADGEVEFSQQEFVGAKESAGHCLK